MRVTYLLLNTNIAILAIAKVKRGNLEHKLLSCVSYQDEY